MDVCQKDIYIPPYVTLYTSIKNFFANRFLMWWGGEKSVDKYHEARPAIGVRLSCCPHAALNKIRGEELIAAYEDLEPG